MKIIPAIDIIEGKCVRLSKGDYDTKKIYNEDPLEVAKRFEAYGIKFLHLVDLDGAKSNHIVNHKVLYNIATKTKLQIDFGGGLKKHEDVTIAFENGAAQITAGSIAAKSPLVFAAWLETYGAEKIILGADCLDRKIATNGWLQQTDDEVVNFIKTYVNKGIKYCICTDISKDGMLQGPSENLYKEILNHTQINLIASGGIASIEDVKKMKQIGCHGTIIGKAIYENKILLKDLSPFL
jgi:phosphoribosylformimino-5-aminoimidazole carboxamide ribotide isomerase